MKKSFEILDLANKLDNQGLHKQADDLTHAAMQRLAAPVARPRPPRGPADFIGSIGQTGLKAMSPYFGDAAKRLLSPETALQKSTKEYIKQLSPQQNRIRDQYRKDAPGGLAQSTAIQTYDPETGKIMAGGQNIDEIMPSMAKYIKNPSYLEALMKAMGGQTLSQLGYSNTSGSAALGSIGSMPYLNSQYGNLGKYVTDPIQGG